MINIKTINFKLVLISIFMVLILPNFASAMQIEIDGKEQQVTQEQVKLVNEILQIANGQQIQDEQPEVATKRSQLKALLLSLGMIGVMALVACLSMRCFIIYQCNQSCTNDHHHKSGTQCKVTFLNMGFGGFEMISPDNENQ